jgi:ATP-dependent exoDNAse (exonuclease V) beta subunit
MFILFNKMLSKINAHPRDSRIVFQDEGHIYTIEGFNGHPISVTTVIHKFFPEFDAEKIIGNMMKGKNWKNSKYYGMSKEEIKKKWKDDGESASKLGTAMHKAIEDYINAEASPPVDELTSCLNQLSLIKIPTVEEITTSSGNIYTIPTIEEQLPKYIIPKVPDVATQTHEFDLFLKFWSELKIGSPGLQAYRTEWLVFDEAKRVAGSIDMTLADADGNIIICDWKRSKEIKRSNLYQKGLKIFNHLDDCNYNHYCLQLNIYRHILETHYGKKIIGMFLVVFHPNNDDYIFIQVPPLQKEVDDLWNQLPIEHK